MHAAWSRHGVAVNAGAHATGVGGTPCARTGERQWLGAGGRAGPRQQREHSAAAATSELHAHAVAHVDSREECSGW